MIKIIGLYLIILLKLPDLERQTGSPLFLLEDGFRREVDATSNDMFARFFPVSSEAERFIFIGSFKS